MGYEGTNIRYAGMCLSLWPGTAGERTTNAARFSRIVYMPLKYAPGRYQTWTRRYEELKRIISGSKYNTKPATLAEINLSGIGIDFISHIEPDWEFDIQ